MTNTASHNTSASELPSSTSVKANKIKVTASNATKTDNTNPSPAKNQKQRRKSKRRRNKTSSTMQQPAVGEHHNTTTPPSSPITSQPHSRSSGTPTQQRPKRVTRAGIYAVAVMLCAMATVQLVRLHQPTSNTTPVSTTQDATPSANAMMLTLTSHVNDLNDKLTQLLEQTTANQAKPTNVSLVDVQDLRQQLHQLMSVQLQHTQTLEALQTHLDHNHDTTRTLLTQLTQTTDEVKHVLEPVHYLDHTTLPFTVVSLDVMQGRPVVSVQYNHATMALEPGFQLAGWTLQQADYVNQVAIFKSPGALLQNGRYASEKHVRVELSDTTRHASPSPATLNPTTSTTTPSSTSGEK